MKNTDIHMRSRIGGGVRRSGVRDSDSYATATRRDESRASMTRARTISQSASACSSRAFYYLIAATQILLLATPASTTRQLQDVADARNHTVPTRLASYDYGIWSTSTVQEHLLRSVPAPTPTSTPTPTSLRPATTERSLSLSSSSSPPSSSASPTTTPLSSESSILPTSPTQTVATPPSKLVLSSSYIKTSTTESTTQGEHHAIKTADPKSSQPTFSRIPVENNDLDEKENPDHLAATQSSTRKGDLVYLKRQMVYQRQEIRQLRLQLTHNKDQITSLQKEFGEFRKQQPKVHNGAPPADISQIRKYAPSTSVTVLSPSTPEPEQRSISLREMLEPFLHLTQLQKKQDFLTTTYADPITSPDPLPQPATSTKPTQTVTLESERGTTLEYHECSDCSKSELRLVDLQKEFESFQRETNVTFGAFLIKLALLKSDSQKVQEVAESLKEEPALKVDKGQIKSPQDEIASERVDDTVSRKVDGIKSGVMNDATIDAAWSKEKTRSEMAEEENVAPTADVDSRSLKHHASHIWSTERDSDIKTDDKERSQISREEGTVKEGVNDRLSDDVAQELESINQKVQLIYDQLGDLEDQLLFVKENTSLSIKHIKDTLRGNTSLLESHIYQHRAEDEKKGLDQEKMSSAHSLSDHTIKDSGIRTSTKKNDTRKKEKESSITNQREKTSDSPQRKTSPPNRDVISVKFSGKIPFQTLDPESVHRNFSWLFDNVQSMQNKMTHLDNTLSELSITLSKLASRSTFEVDETNETIDGIISAATEKSTSDHLGRDEDSDEKGYQNKSLSKDDEAMNIDDIPEQETNNSQSVSGDKILAVNRSEEWKSGSQMISDSAEQIPEATLNMLESLMSWIHDLDAQIQKLKSAVDVMKTRIMYMLSIVEQLHPKDTKIEESVKDESENTVDSSLLLNSTLARSLQTKKVDPSYSASPAVSLATSTSSQLTSSTPPLVNISDVHERFLRNRTIPSFENSGVDISDSNTETYRLSNFSEFENFLSNRSTTIIPVAADLNVSTVESANKIVTPLPTNVRIMDAQNMSSKETGSLETALDNVHDLLKRVKILESQMQDLSEERLLETKDSELSTQTDYLGSGTTEEVPVAYSVIVNKIAFNMSKLQTQIANIKRNMSLQENQLNAVKDDVFILDENMDYLGRELSDLELKQRRDDRFYHSQQIIESNLSLTEVAAQVSQILAPKQELTNQNLRELNDSLSKQWTALNLLKETAARQESNFSRMVKHSHSFQEKILYVDLTKRRYKIYNSTPVVSCSSMKDADRTFLNNKTQTCYYGYGNTKMLPYNAAKRKCEDAGLHMVFMETQEEREYVAKEITQVIGGHWMGAERFDYGWYWVRGCDAVDSVFEPPWRYNHSVNYKRAIIWGDKWSGKYPGQHYRFVCEEEPFKEEICDGFQSFNRVKEWLSDAFFRSFNTLHVVDCGRLCLADPSCKGFRFRKSGHHKCALYNRGNTTTTKKKTTCDAPGEVCYSRIERCFS